MVKRNFEDWLQNFRANINNYDYYVDFTKVYSNAEKFRIELHMLNSLIVSKDIERDFLALVNKYPEVLKCIPLLLATRAKELSATDENGFHLYDFYHNTLTAEQYADFMRKTGLFNLLEKHIVNNLFDYVIGVEVGLDSNGRKNRVGHLMENLVEKFLIKNCFQKNETYFKEVYIQDITNKWGLDLSAISNNGKTEKRFDFVVKTPSMIYGIETNFYASQGSKLNETARSYKTLALEADAIDGFSFVWITDGQGWMHARHNLLETFEAMQHLYNITDLENGILSEVLK